MHAPDAVRQVLQVRAQPRESPADARRRRSPHRTVRRSRRVRGGRNQAACRQPYCSDTGQRSSSVNASRQCFGAAQPRGFQRSGVREGPCLSGWGDRFAVASPACECQGRRGGWILSRDAGVAEDAVAGATAAAYRIYEAGFFFVFGRSCAPSSSPYGCLANADSLQEKRAREQEILHVKTGGILHERSYVQTLTLYVQNHWRRTCTNGYVQNRAALNNQTGGGRLCTSSLIQHMFT